MCVCKYIRNRSIVTTTRPDAMMMEHHIELIRKIDRWYPEGLYVPVNEGVNQARADPLGEQGLINDRWDCWVHQSDTSC